VQLYYYRDPAGNFGDDLNPWLWPKLLSVPVEHCFDDDTLFIGVGSLLNHKVPPTPAKKIVFGAGCGYGTTPDITPAWRFYCVRGPLSAHVLDLPPTAAVSDAALLVRGYLEPTANETVHRAAFMPHHLTHHYDRWQPICDELGIAYVDPTAPVEHTLETIRTSAVVITEAMHGAIVADAFRVPWIPVRTRPRISRFKWTDWSHSMRLEHRFEWLPPVWSPSIDCREKRVLHPVLARASRERLRWLLKFGRRRLSSDAVFQEVYARLRSRFDEMAAAASVDNR
jgi:succinoglycan biosynthesis protein ExoV